jgi:hypothetical protein
MNPRSVLDTLRRLCEDLDAGRPIQRVTIKSLVLPIAVPAAMGLAALTLGGCPDMTPLYGGPWDSGVSSEDNCADGLDNDGDDDIDCNDMDCEDDIACMPLYGVATEDDCNDEVDNDGDSTVDCCDTDCAEDENCLFPMCPAYGGPYEEENCSDCRDDMDCDGLIDCDDPDCAGDPACG